MQEIQRIYRTVSMSHVSEDTPPIRSRAQWILRLLYAPDSRGRKKRPIFGKTRLMKSVFLLHRKLNEHFPEVDTGFEFRPDKYGPLDPEVYAAVTYLQNHDFIEVTPPDEHSDQYDSVKYSLTPEGARKAEELYRALPGEQRSLVDWIKREHAMKELGELLAFVYNQYPEMTTKSKLT